MPPPLPLLLPQLLSALEALSVVVIARVFLLQILFSLYSVGLK
jgi:hypothetical protein